MPQVKKEQKRCRKPENQHKVSSFSAANAAESRIQFSKNPKKKRFMFVKLKGLGCKGTPLTAPASAPAIIRSAAEWEPKGARNKNRNQKKRKPLQNRRNLDNVVVDVPDVCCTPPGIGIASDVAPRATNPVPRLDHRKHSREARRNDDDAGAVLSVGIGSRTAHRSASAEEIIEMLMSRQALLPGSILRRHDQYRDWRLDVDDMSYEELLDLGDKIGYVGTGLKEAEISNCLRKFKHFNHDSTSLLVAGHHKDWECSICQEKCMTDDEIGILECGHHHHLECIKQWLKQKNACPVCKSAALLHKSK